MDQKALKWLLDQTKMLPRQYCWLDDIQALCPELQWIKGSKNTIADALSCCAHDHSIGIQVHIINIQDFDPIFLQRLKEGLLVDTELQALITSVQDKKQFSRYTLQDGLLWYDGHHLVIPTTLRLPLLQDNHDSPTAGHPSKNITYDLLA